ncbi:hypothetical protein, partial [Aeromonas salmonicida]|uniref:hypothetical protein n=1 Tax=Aeromonas salmonicida TaxID=645 RepID=UPI00195A5B9E
MIQPVKKNVLPALYLSAFCSYEICSDHRYRGENRKSNCFVTDKGPATRQMAGPDPNASQLSLTGIVFIGFFYTVFLWPWLH